jgi:2-methylcitrate dehydratase PrpD
VFGAIAAASASSVLRRLDADAASRAVGIAASLAGGVVANFGTMTKPFQVGRAAQSGLTATRLAQAGATAAPDALEHELGFLAAVSPRGQVDVKSPAALGETWRILESGVNIKQYPMCYGAHRVVDATIDLCRANKVAAADIANVDVELGEAQAVMLRNHRPQSGLDAKFSLEFAVAAAAISGRCTNAELSTEFVRRADVQDFFARVRSRTVAGRDPDDPAFGLADRVRMSLRDGRQLDSTPVHHPRGHFKRPLERDALWQKFSDCAVGVIGAERSRTLFEALGNLPVLASLSELGSVRSARDGAGRRASVR